MDDFPRDQLLPEKLDEEAVQGKYHAAGKSREPTSGSKQTENEDAFGGPVFHPPLYRQRYQAVINIAREHHPKKVLDLGCSECKLIRYLKNEPYIEDLCGVDIDDAILLANEHIVQPLTSDYLHPRDNPLTVRLLLGSVADFDSRLAAYDFVICVELIEHLDAPVLDAMSVTVFNRICPKVAVVTTPNAEFNELFPDFKGFRHWDHRFEWTRQEFQKWGNTVALKFNYTVSYSGVGSGPAGSEHLGFCSQMAVFTRDGPGMDHTHRESSPSPYKLIADAVHPCKKKIPRDQEVLLEVQYYTSFLSRKAQGDGSDAEEGEDSTGCLETISLQMLMQFPRVRSLCETLDELRDILKKSDQVNLTEDGTSIVVQTQATDTHPDSEDAEDLEDCEIAPGHSSVSGLPDDNSIQEELWE